MIKKLLIIFLLFTTSLSARDINWSRYFKARAKYGDYVESLVKTYPVKIYLVYAVASWECNWGANTMQVKGGPKETRASLRCGVKNYLARFNREYRGSQLAILTAYSGGIGYLRNMVKRQYGHKEKPPKFQNIYKETRWYLARVDFHGNKYAQNVLSLAQKMQKIDQSRAYSSLISANCGAGSFLNVKI
jgi:hypothetical protein